jgi:acetyl-CoA synthetase
VAQSDELTGQAIVAFVTLQGDLEGTPEIETKIRDHVAERIGKLARPKRILWSEELPKTRSGKIMRRLLRDVADGRALGDVTTLRDPTAMASCKQRSPPRDLKRSSKPNTSRDQPASPHARYSASRLTRPVRTRTRAPLPSR